MKCPGDRGHAENTPALRNERAAVLVSQPRGRIAQARERHMTARSLSILAAALLLVSPNLWAQSQPADPPDRVGRLSDIEGTVQQRTPDDNDWVAANLNYPVTTGFAIAPQDGGHAEIEVGTMALRVGPVSELDVTTLTERETSLTLAQGELNLRVGQL